MARRRRSSVIRRLGGARKLSAMGLSNPTHVLILVLVVVLLFGARRLPELGRSLGSGIREFRGSLAARDGDSVAPAVEPNATTVPQAAPRPAEPVGPGPSA
jgi:sec-independent protein translocase protein TatA